MRDGTYGDYIKENGVWRNPKFRYDPRVSALNSPSSWGMTEQEVLDASDAELTRIAKENK